MKTWKKFKKQRGFSLVEMILVLALSSLAFIGIIKYEQKKGETLQAENAGLQFQEVGQALGQYINRQSAVLIANIPAGSTAVMPLSVMQGTASGFYPAAYLLPASYSNQNMFRTNYVVVLRNTANNIHGMVLSSTPVVDASGSVRYDWIGTAMKKAGPQSGMTFMTATQLSGLDGGWSTTNSDYPQITAAGQLGYRVTYQGNGDDVYLRLDGAYPMKGNLSMGNYNINDATDVNYTGWLNGNNALLNNLRTGFIYNAGNIVNQGNIETLSAVGAGSGNFARFDKLTANIELEATAINATTKNNVTIGDPNAANGGVLIVKDIYLGSGNGGGGGRAVDGYLSDRLPRYVSRGIYLVAHDAMLTQPSCPGGLPKIELVPQSQWLQGRVMGTLAMATDASNNITMTQDQYTVGAMSVYAINNGASWTVKIETPAYNGAYVGGNALAHVYCDYMK